MPTTEKEHDMTPKQESALIDAVKDLNDAAYLAGQSGEAEYAYERHLIRSRALVAVYGIIRAIRETS